VKIFLMTKSKSQVQYICCYKVSCVAIVILYIPIASVESDMCKALLVENFVQIES